jgi:hypothetical protein
MLAKSAPDCDAKTANQLALGLPQRSNRFSLQLRDLAPPFIHGSTTQRASQAVGRRNMTLVLRD